VRYVVRTNEPQKRAAASVSHVFNILLTTIWGLVGSDCGQSSLISFLTILHFSTLISHRCHATGTTPPRLTIRRPPWIKLEAGVRLDAPCATSLPWWASLFLHTSWCFFQLPLARPHLPTIQYQWQMRIRQRNTALGQQHLRAPLSVS